jgi:hypothetical protein
MFYTDALLSTDGFVPERSLLLEKPICAIQLAYQASGERKLGLLTQLPSGTTGYVCGPGFNERTVKVRVNGQYYFVFLQDIQVPEAFGPIA